MKTNPKRYFFPEEWNQFFAVLKKPEHQALFLTLLHTGARIMEALHLKVSSFDFERCSVDFKVVKRRTLRKRYSAKREGRGFRVGQEYIKKIKRFVTAQGLGQDDYLFLNNEKLPLNYSELINTEKKKYYATKKTAYSALFKRKLRKAGIKDFHEFSLHNIRKTYGNWMRALGIEIAEITYRMGHDQDTFLEHYGSAMLFTQQERMKIERIMGTFI